MRFYEWIVQWIMHVVTWILTTLVAALLITGSAAAQEATTPIDALARAFKAEQQVPGLVVGWVDRAGTHVRPYGVASLPDSTQIHADTRFEIGSVTKAFTGLLLAERARHGAVALNAPIGRILPDSVQTPTVDGQPIRLAHLATHTSGLPRLPDNLQPAAMADPYADYTAARLYAFLDGASLSTAPGSTYAYSNVGAGLLGHLLARRANTTYAALLRRRVLQPLGLDATGVPAPSDTFGAHLAQGYGPLGAASYWHFDALAGAGALRSTPADLLRFLQAQLQPAATPLAAAIRQTHRVRHRMANRQAVTLGWHVAPAPDGHRLYWHNGGTGGFRSFIGFLPAEGIGFVVLTNKAVPLRPFNRFAFQLVPRMP